MTTLTAHLRTATSSTPNPDDWPAPATWWDEIILTRPITDEDDPDDAAGDNDDEIVVTTTAVESSEDPEPYDAAAEKATRAAGFTNFTWGDDW